MSKLERTRCRFRVLTWKGTGKRKRKNTIMKKKNVQNENISLGSPVDQRKSLKWLAWFLTICLKFQVWYVHFGHFV